MIQLLVECYSLNTTVILPLCFADIILPDPLPPHYHHDLLIALCLRIPTSATCCSPHISYLKKKRRLFILILKIENYSFPPPIPCLFVIPFTFYKVTIRHPSAHKAITGNNVVADQFIIIYILKNHCPPPI